MKWKITFLALGISISTISFVWAGSEEQNQEISLQNVQNLSFQDVIKQSTAIEIRTYNQGSGWSAKMGKVMLPLNEAIRTKLNGMFGSNASFMNSLKPKESTRNFISRRKWDLFGSRFKSDPKFLDRWSLDAVLKFYARDTEIIIDLWSFESTNQQLIPVLFFTMKPSNVVDGSTLIRGGEIGGAYWNQHTVSKPRAILRQCLRKIPKLGAKFLQPQCDSTEKYVTLLEGLTQLAPLQHIEPTKTPKVIQ